MPSCEGFFEKQPDNVMAGEDNYEDPSNLYGSFIGLLGTIQDAADHLIIVSELMGDLMTPTAQAPEEYWEVFRYQAAEGNPVADPAPLYRIVLNCNDFLRNTVEYNQKYPGVIPANSYRQLIAGAVTLRTWAYLNIGKIYGEAVYYDYAMTSEQDISQFPVLTFDELIPELIHFLTTGVDRINGLVRVDVDTILGVSGVLWRRMVIQADILLTELYLWNRDYEAAAKRGINLITSKGLLGISGNNQNFTCGYAWGSDINGTNPWRDLFFTSPVERHLREGLTIVFYNYNQLQTNQLQYLFSAVPPNVYYLAPTSAMTSLFSGRDYYTGTSVVTDPRGVNVSYGTEMGETVIMKYHSGREYYEHDAHIFLYRGGELHLMIAEALAALGNYDAADYIINCGFSPTHISGSTFDYPFDAPIYAYEGLKVGMGVRGRVDVPEIMSTSERFIGDLVEGMDGYEERRHFVLDSIILQETARELAYEGKRWFTAVRIARNSDRADLLAEVISGKFGRTEAAAYKDLLRDPKNWFIKYDLRNKD